MSAPDLTTEIVGYRQWRVTPDLELRAAAHRDHATWSVGDNEALCHRMDSDRGQFAMIDPSSAQPAPCGDTPGRECECGFYALHHPGDLWYGKVSRATTAGGRIGFAVSDEELDPLVSGVIVAWGNIQVHHQGFRSQFARVAALAVPATKRDAVIVRAAAEAYGVPCVGVDALPKIADEFGASIPHELRPAKPEPKAEDLFIWGSIHMAMPAGFSSFGTPLSASSGISFSPPPPPPPPARRPAGRRFGLPAKTSNRQGPHEGKQRAPKHQRGKPWGAW